MATKKPARPKLANAKEAGLFSYVASGDADAWRANIHWAREWGDPRPVIAALRKYPVPIEAQQELADYLEASITPKPRKALFTPTEADLIRSLFRMLTDPDGKARWSEQKALVELALELSESGRTISPDTLYDVVKERKTYRSRKK